MSRTDRLTRPRVDTNGIAEHISDEDRRELATLNDARVDAQLAFDEAVARVRRKHKLYADGARIDLTTGLITRA